MKKWIKRIIWIVIVFAIGAGGYFLLRPKEKKTVYTTAAVERGNLAQTVSVTGKLDPSEQIDLSFGIGGKIIRMNVKEGDYVMTRQILAQVESGTLIFSLKEAEQNVKIQKKTLSSMKDKDDLYNKNDRDAQKAKISSAEAGVDLVLTQIGFTKIYSPKDSVVLKKYYEAGERVAANAAVLTIGNPGDLVIESNIPESDITKIKIGQKADVVFDALSEKSFEAEVFEVDPASTVIQDVVYYRIKLKLSTLDPELKAGMSSDLDIRTAEANDVLMVPMRGVQTDERDKFVQILIDELTGQIEKRKVETGLEGDEGMVEIKSGLKEGERVVTFTKVE